MPSISIVIPTYNMQKSLARCLESIGAQTLRPDEVIVVDDGSGDRTVEIVRARGRSPVQLPVVYIRQDHAGASAARNRGFAASSGDCIMFLDADVALKNHALQRLSETLQQQSGNKKQETNIGYAYSAFKWGWKKFSSFPFDPARLRMIPYIHTTSLIQRSVLPEKPFDESLKRLQDWDLYLTLLERGVGGAYIPEILFAVKAKGTMSSWLPSFAYHIPLGRFGVKIESLEKYREAEKMVRMKHWL